MLFTPVKPMLVTTGNEIMDDDSYINEIKWDGWRILLHKQGDRIEAYTRNGRMVTHQFPELKGLAGSIHAESAIIDCEGVCIRDERSIFDDFSYRASLTNPIKIEQATVTHPAAFVAFDLLYVNGINITGEPLLERKQRLQELFQPSSALIQTMYVEGQATALKRLTVDKNMEGIVSKLKDSRYYLDTRSDAWMKFKNWKTIDCVILGYRKEPQFQLIVGLHFPTIQNKPVAVVDYGMKPEEKVAFMSVAKQIHTRYQKGTQWIEPKLCCQIQYLERTERHQLRIVTFKGFLFDKHPEQCRWVS